MKSKDMFGRPLQSGQKSVLGQRFRWPPFSILNAQTGSWQDRKRQWISLGIKSELGRGEALTWDDGVRDIDEYRHREGRKTDARAFHAGGLDNLEEYRDDLSQRRELAQTYRMDQYVDEYRPKKANATPGGSPRPMSRGYMKELTAKQQAEEAERIRANATPGGSPMPAMNYSQTKARGDGRGRPMATNKYHAQPGGGPGKGSVWLGADKKPVGGDSAINASKQTADLRNGLVFRTTCSPYEGFEGSEASQSGTSIFDPVICELFYRWFTPVEGMVLDPFAGGSVRGIVAAGTGRNYTGVDLRPEQVAANEKQVYDIRFAKDPETDKFVKPEWIRDRLKKYRPNWIEGDSRDIDAFGDFQCDAVFSCPPYYDLELYSGDPRDLSNTTWDDFCDSYCTIIKKSVASLKDNRFACFVVGDLRDKEGFYRRLPSITIEMFEEAGCRLYNDLVLLTAVGSLPLRVHAQFSKSRKVGRGHQSMLVFCKGDPWKAAAACEHYEALSVDVVDSDD